MGPGSTCPLAHDGRIMQIDDRLPGADDRDLLPHPLSILPR
jgi:hypothetical protein